MLMIQLDINDWILRIKAEDEVWVIEEESARSLRNDWN